jgi:hypothetical protein
LGSKENIMKRSPVLILTSIVIALIVAGVGSLMALIQVAKSDAIRHMAVHGAKKAYVARIRPSLRHGLWMELRFSNKDSQVTGMHWYLIPWRDHEIIK